MFQNSLFIERRTFGLLLLLLLQLGDGVDGADVDAVQDVEQDLGQPQQISEVVETKVDEVSRQVHYLCREESDKRLNDFYQEVVRSSIATNTINQRVN